MNESFQKHMMQHLQSGALDPRNPKDLAGQKKTPLRLLSPLALAHVSMAMKHGAEKYGPFNWREKPIGYILYLEAAKRHLDLLLDGEDLDEDSKQHHAAHVASCAMIILDALEVGTLKDDRIKSGKLSALYKKFNAESLPAKSPPPVITIHEQARSWKYFRTPQQNTFRARSLDTFGEMWERGEWCRSGPPSIQHCMLSAGWKRISIEEAAALGVSIE